MRSWSGPTTTRSRGGGWIQPCGMGIVQDIGDRGGRRWRGWKDGCGFMVVGRRRRGSGQGPLEQLGRDGMIGLTGQCLMIIVDGPIGFVEALTDQGIGGIARGLVRTEGNAPIITDQGGLVATQFSQGVTQIKDGRFPIGIHTQFDQFVQTRHGTRRMTSTTSMVVLLYFGMAWFTMIFVQDRVVVVPLFVVHHDDQTQYFFKAFRSWFVVSLEKGQDPQFVPSQWISGTGLDGRGNKGLRQTVMIGPRIFHTHVQETEIFAGTESLGGAKTRQGLIGFIAGGKGTTKGNPGRCTMRIQAGGPTIMSLGNVRTTAGTVIGPDGKPGGGLLWLRFHPGMGHLKQGALVTRQQESGHIDKGDIATGPTAAHTRRVASGLQHGGIQLGQFVTKLQDTFPLIATIGALGGHGQYLRCLLQLVHGLQIVKGLVHLNLQQLLVLLLWICIVGCFGCRGRRKQGIRGRGTTTMRMRMSGSGRMGGGRRYHGNGRGIQQGRGRVVVRRGTTHPTRIVYGRKETATPHSSGGTLAHGFIIIIVVVLCFVLVLVVARCRGRVPWLLCHNAGGRLRGHFNPRPIQGNQPGRHDRRRRLYRRGLLRVGSELVVLLLLLLLLQVVTKGLSLRGRPQLMIEQTGIGLQGSTIQLQGAGPIHGGTQHMTRFVRRSSAPGTQAGQGMNAIVEICDSRYRGRTIVLLLLWLLLLLRFAVQFLRPCFVPHVPSILVLIFQGS